MASVTSSGSPSSRVASCTRAATFTGSPITPSSTKPPPPMVPTSTSPELTPIPMRQRSPKWDSTALEHVRGRRERAVGMVRQRLRGAEHAQQPVAEQLVDVPAVLPQDRDRRPRRTRSGTPTASRAVARSAKVVKPRMSTNRTVTIAHSARRCSLIVRSGARSHSDTCAGCIVSRDDGAELGVQRCQVDLVAKPGREGLERLLRRRSGAGRSGGRPPPGSAPGRGGTAPPPPASSRRPRGPEPSVRPPRASWSSSTLPR